MNAPGFFICRCRPPRPAPGGHCLPNMVFNNLEPLPSPPGMGACAPVAKLADAAFRATAARAACRFEPCPAHQENLRAVSCGTAPAGRGGAVSPDVANCDGCGRTGRRLRDTTEPASRPGATPSRSDQAGATTPDCACRWARANNETIGTARACPDLGGDTGSILPDRVQAARGSLMRRWLGGRVPAVEQEDGGSTPPCRTRATQPP